MKAGRIPCQQRPASMKLVPAGASLRAHGFFVQAGCWPQPGGGVWAVSEGGLACVGSNSGSSCSDKKSSKVTRIT